MREFDPTILTADPSMSNHEELTHDLANDPFASYFNTVENPTTPPKILITTSPQVSKATYDFCDELLGVFPGAEFRRRKGGKGFELGRIAGWAADRGYKHMCVVNEDMKKPSAYLPCLPDWLSYILSDAITVIYLPNGPSAYFKLTSIELTKQIFV
jgi:ribosome production factor 1